MPDEIYATETIHRNAQSWRDGGWSTMEHNGSEIYHSDAKYKALESRIDELLEQQRESCAKAYHDFDKSLTTYCEFEEIEQTIRNARIDK